MNMQICIRGTARVTQASKNIPDKRLKLYGHVNEREEEHMYNVKSAKSTKEKRTTKNEMETHNMSCRKKLIWKAWLCSEMR